MSVGVIYRYFANKEAIIEAIVANDLAAIRAKFAEWDAVPDENLLDKIIEIMGEALEHKYNPDNAGLALEVMAEAARNPRVAAIVSKGDAQERALGMTLLNRITPGRDPEQTRARDEVISMLFDGMMIRAISNPDVDRKALLATLRPVIRLLFTLPDHS